MDRLLSWTPFGDSRTPWRALFSYAFDYAIIVALAITYAALDKLLTPFNQLFSLTDKSIQYPFAQKERIPIFEAIIISCAFPAGVIIVYTLVLDGLFSHRKQPSRKVWTFKERLWQLNCGILGLLLAQGAAFCITGSLKNLIGRPRPDFIDRCNPRPDSVDAAVFGLSSSGICQQTDKAIMADASFAGLFYLSLYLSAKLHVMDQRGEVWRTFIVITPTIAAACIAASRIMDYRHHAFDVLFGSALGLLCGWGAYRQYFPPLSHSWLKGRAYPMREWGVPIRAPPDSAQYADYRGGRLDRTAGILAPSDEEGRYPSTIYPERQTTSSYGLEPMRPRIPFPSSAHSSPGFEHVTTAPPIDDSDYEHVRPQQPPRPNSKPAIAVTMHHSPSSSDNLPQANTFRTQVAVNQVRRTGTSGSEDDDGLYRQQPLTNVGPRPLQ